jgi:hypothetical protein
MTGFVRASGVVFYRGQPTALPSTMFYTPIFHSGFGAPGIDMTRRWPETKALARSGKTRDTLGLALSGGCRAAIFCDEILRELTTRAS